MRVLAPSTRERQMTSTVTSLYAYFMKHMTVSILIERRLFVLYRRAMFGMILRQRLISRF